MADMWMSGEPKFKVKAFMSPSTAETSTSKQYEDGDYYFIVHQAFIVLPDTTIVFDEGISVLT